MTEVDDLSQEEAEELAPKVIENMSAGELASLMNEQQDTTPKKLRGENEC